MAEDQPPPESWNRGAGRSQLHIEAILLSAIMWAGRPALAVALENQLHI